MSEEKKYPKVIAGVFLFNENDELLLLQAPKWHNKYTNVGGKVELNETIEEAVAREAKEETDLDIFDLKLITIISGLGLEESYKLNDNHLIFIDYQAKAKDYKRLKLNEEATKYKWLKLDEWLKMDELKFAPYIIEVLQKLKKQQEENFEDKYKRAMADYQNLIKQTAKEKQEFVKYANEHLLYEILPVYDNLRLALEHANKTPNNANIIKGVECIIKQFKSVLENWGIEEIKTIGEKFNHNTMEAIEGRGETVKQEVRPGYKLRGKVIAPAKVILE
ncbi:nucleotide exchange factor GrpE [Patescibacteria group bacterium]|nr:nucleotide exchange factor GrpE [Patescibacteria group bacterium]MBU4455114.1 nucleotide exchange factor GrpE [Patescibacteria group bacterium]MCG2690721.1 nucleotide exchange factor GrpE [Candidatus Parcubacteria bacterium]